MNKKAVLTIYGFGILTFLLLFEVYYLNKKDKNLEQKQLFVKLTKLPDLAISNETHYIRNRSLTTVFEIYKDDGSLREYAKTSFVVGDFR